MNRNPTLTIIMISALLISIVASFQPVNPQVTGNVYINADGSITGTDKIRRDNNVYTLIDDISGSVPNGEAFFIVLRDNIVIDGSSHVLQGYGTGIGIHLRSRQNVTIKNLEIKNFGTGIGFGIGTNTPRSENDSQPTALNNQILNNYITAPYWGIELTHANDTVISGNTIISTDPKYGMSFNYCSKILCSNNKLIGGSLTIWSSSQITLLNNTVGNKPLIYLEGESNQTIDDAGQLFLINCNNMTIKNVNPPANFRVTIQLQGTNTSQIANCAGQISLTNSHYNTINNNQLSGNAIELSNSSYNTINSNTLTTTGNNGINLEFSNTNNIYANTIYNSSTGIRLVGCLDNNIFRNSLNNNDVGIALTYIIFTSYDPRCITNSVYENNINECKQGISLGSAFENKIFRNNITTSVDQGIRLYCSDNNSFYNNNFIDNNQHVYEEHSGWTGMGYPSYYSKNNSWNSSSLVGGNYWTGYVGFDNDGNGIGDTPYVLDANNTDHNPLIKPLLVNNTYSIPTFPSPSPSPTSSSSPSPTIVPTSTPNPTNTSSPSPNPTPNISPSNSPTQQPTLSPSPTLDNNQAEDYTPIAIIVGLVIAVIVVMSVLIYLKKRRG